MHPAPALTVLSMSALLTACGQDPTSIVPRDRLAAVNEALSVSGHMERDLSDEFIGTVLERYSFIAHTIGDGVVQGTFEVRDFGPGLEDSWAKGRVTCLSLFTDGVTARIGGIVESAGIPEFVGSEAAWWVQDNGEGPDVDFGTDLRWGLPLGSAQDHCQVGFLHGTFGPSSRGNVQIRGGE